MAIIIKHMEMPNGCCECRMQTENCCTLSLRKIDDIFTRPTWCKLKEISCKDCKWHNEEDLFCRYWAVLYGHAEIYPSFSPLDFCSRGIRKDGEENG